MLQLHLRDQQSYCPLRRDLYYMFDDMYFYQGHVLYIVSGQSPFVWHLMMPTFHINPLIVNTMRSVFQNRSHMSATSTHSFRESRSNVSLWHTASSGMEPLFENPEWLPVWWLLEALMWLFSMSFTPPSNPFSGRFSSLCHTLADTIWDSLLTFSKVYKRQG